MSLKSTAECVPFPYDINPLDFYLYDFLEERICADTPNTIKELKDTSVSEFGHLLSQLSDKAMADAEERQPAGCDLESERSNRAICSKRC